MYWRIFNSVCSIRLRYSRKVVWQRYKHEFPQNLQRAERRLFQWNYHCCIHFHERCYYSMHRWIKDTNKNNPITPHNKSWPFRARSQFINLEINQTKLAATKACHVILIPTVFKISCGISECRRLKNKSFFLQIHVRLFVSLSACLRGNETLVTFDTKRVRRIAPSVRLRLSNWQQN